MATFSLSREEVAEKLGVSTRSVDRYIKRGQLSYKKIANKVYIAEEDVQKLASSFNSVQQHPTSERISESTDLSNKKISDSDFGQQVDKFITVLQEKDRMVEDKNKVIFMLQQRVGELETKLQHMIALPDYNSEKQEIMLEKDRLIQEISRLKM
ncbi:MAG: helix-turn-helix domain-containing protein [Candidatus Peribacteria bacterium]|nr:MAG: helix-turn-helix domain-containing protein [Candidatus Peribacteria bacterium]